MTYLQPMLPLLLVLGIVGVIRSWRRTEGARGPWLVIVSLAGIWMLSIEAGAWVLSRPLEMRYQEQTIPRSGADAIVVLAGAVNAPLPNRPYPVAGQDTYRRVRHAAWLFHTWKQVPVLASGGGKQGIPLAQTMREMLTAERVPPDQIWLESRSTNTHEGAVFGSEILRAHGISRVVLVVEASSMPRAALCFKKAGIEVTPAPVRYTRPPGLLSDFLPNWSGISSNEETVHEIVGLAWYKLRGWI